MNNLFQTFYDKLPEDVMQVMPKYNKCFLVTFLTPRYMVTMDNKYHELYNNFDFICSDGNSPIKMNKLCGKPKSLRISFDMSSLGKMVLTELSLNGNGLYILGSTQDSLEKFVSTIRNEFSGISILGYHNGYITGDKKEIIDEIIQSEAKVVIIGMGAPLQDEMAVALKNSGFVGTIYTCGGFIHQAAVKLNFWPEWTNKYNLRWFYRYFCEKGTIKRLPYSLLSITRYTLFLLFNCKTVKK